MAGRLAQAIDRWCLRRVQGRWTQASADAPDLDPFELRALRGEARLMRRQIDRVIHAADARLSLPLLQGEPPRMALGTDWVWRPDAWHGSLPQPGLVAADRATQISDDLALYHDCPLSEIALRQVQGGADALRAPYALAVEVFGFRGSFLSLSASFPEAAVGDLGLRHLVRLDAVIEADRPLKAYARLNIKHGDAVAQMISDLPDGPEKWAEFDLAYGQIGAGRIERVWLDLIFNDAAQTRILLRDVVVSRRPRAEL
ncbi:DUF6478 family protein [Tabrizicola aquatica]|uniref:DUF6478 family protein n=1 Tax=Tabrizicola aquatica TaxID=909926 RepID=UPI000CD31119|nr:DUF6478 family protein [Tabrizicola aquatica]